MNADLDAVRAVDELTAAKYRNAHAERILTELIIRIREITSRDSGTDDHEGDMVGAAMNAAVAMGWDYESLAHGHEDAVAVLAEYIRTLVENTIASYGPEAFYDDVATALDCDALADRCIADGMEIAGSALSVLVRSNTWWAGKVICAILGALDGRVSDEDWDELTRDELVAETY